MYQLQVKRWLVQYRFPVRDGWDVTVDVDAMERGEKGQHPAGKKELVVLCEEWMRSEGVKLVGHPLYGRVDMVACKASVGTFLIEVEGDTSRRKEQAMYSALGQTILSMKHFSPDLTYALAVPDDYQWERQLRKVPSRIRELLSLKLFLVSESEVREISD